MAARHRRGRSALALGVVLTALALIVPAARAGIVAKYGRDGRCTVVASIPGVVGWELRLERRQGGRWLQVASPGTWTFKRGTFTCSRVARARIRARATRAGSPDRPVTSTITQPAPIQPQVRVLYVRPRDRTARDDFVAAIGNAATEVQRWYAAQLGRSFRLSSRGVERCVLPRAAAHYADRTLSRVLKDLQPCRAVSYASPSYVWLVYVDVDHGCGRREPLGVGTPGLAILPRDDLDGLVGVLGTSDCGDQLFGDVGRWIGGAGHELGHGLGLSHPPGCDKGLASCDSPALMWQGYANFPNTYLTERDRVTLLRSPFITPDWATPAR